MAFPQGFYLSFSLSNISDDKQFKITSVDIQLFFIRFNLSRFELFIWETKHLVYFAVLRLVYFGFVPFTFVNVFINL